MIDAGWSAPAIRGEFFELSFRVDESVMLLERALGFPGVHVDRVLALGELIEVRHDRPCITTLA